MSASAYIEVVPQQQQLTSGTSPVRLLTVGMADADYEELARFLKEPDCKLHRAAARRDAARVIRRHWPNVVMCEPSLPDGTWQDLLGDVQSQPRAPMLIVCSLLADERLWAEVLNIGGYDVLMKPFRAVEVIRVIRMAARQAG